MNRKEMLHQQNHKRLCITIIGLSTIYICFGMHLYGMPIYLFFKYINCTQVDDLFIISDLLRITAVLQMGDRRIAHILLLL